MNSTPPLKTKYIETPEEMYSYFEAYKADLEANPRIKVEYVGKNGDRVETPLKRPLTIEGFKNYCARNVCDIQAYLNNRDGAYPTYSPILSRIKDEIRQEQLEGGLLLQYSQTLTARINGLTDKQESTVRMEVIETTLDLGNEIPNTDNPTPKL